MQLLPQNQPKQKRSKVTWNLVQTTVNDSVLDSREGRIWQVLAVPFWMASRHHNQERSLRHPHIARTNKEKNGLIISLRLNSIQIEWTSIHRCQNFLRRALDIDHERVTHRHHNSDGQHKRLTRSLLYTSKRAIQSTHQHNVTDTEWVKACSTNSSRVEYLDSKVQKGESQKNELWLIISLESSIKFRQRRSTNVNWSILMFLNRSNL